MSDTIKAKKILVTRDCVVGKKCDVCGKEIPPTRIPHKYGEPVYDYYKVTRHHNDWGNDSVDSYEHYDACSPECASAYMREYLEDSAGGRNSMIIEIEHESCWTLRDTEVSGDD